MRNQRRGEFVIGGRDLDLVDARRDVLRQVRHVHRFQFRRWPAAVGGSVAFHCTKRAAGEAIGPPFGESIGADHALQFFCGWSRLPLRVSTAICAAVQAASKLRRPHSENMPDRRRRFRSMPSCSRPGRSRRPCRCCRWRRRAAVAALLKAVICVAGHGQAARCNCMGDSTR